MRRDGKSGPRGIVGSFVRIFRIVLTCCFAVLLAGTLAWFGHQWIVGTQEAKSIETGWARIAGSAPVAQPKPGDIIGRIVIPRIALDSPLIEMANVDDMPNLDRGPSHIATTALPGARGNCVVAGHRTTHTRPFLHIDQLVSGDELQFIDTSGRVYKYVVTGQLIVDPDDVSVMDPTPTPTATLIACHPPFSARWRIIVKAVLK
ncbi:MAG: sortase [Candidatus Geothermincolia bacterium]